MDPARNSPVSLSLQRTVARTLRFVFGLVFVYSGAAKYLAVAEFKAALTSLSILPPLLIPFVAIAIPALEIYLGAAIALGLKTVLHCKLNVLMLAIFTAVMAVEIASGTEASCGCFGNITDGRIGPITVVRNVGLLIWGIFLASYYDARDGPGNTVQTAQPAFVTHLWQGSYLPLAYRTLSPSLCLLR